MNLQNTFWYVYCLAFPLISILSVIIASAKTAGEITALLKTRRVWSGSVLNEHHVLVRSDHFFPKKFPPLFFWVFKHIKIDLSLLLPGCLCVMQWWHQSISKSCSVPLTIHSFTMFTQKFNHRMPEQEETICISLAKDCTWHLFSAVPQFISHGHFRQNCSIAKSLQCHKTQHTDL